jgi:hypothetical protein
MSLLEPFFPAGTTSNDAVFEGVIQLLQYLFFFAGDPWISKASEVF